MGRKSGPARTVRQLLLVPGLPACSTIATNNCMPPQIPTTLLSVGHWFGSEFRVAHTVEDQCLQYLRNTGFDSHALTANVELDLESKTTELSSRRRRRCRRPCGSPAPLSGDASEGRVAWRFKGRSFPIFCPTGLSNNANLPSKT